MSFSDHTEAALLNSLFGKSSDFGALGSAPTMFVALCESAPTDSDTGSTITESTYTSYDRVSTDSTDWNSASGTSPTTLDNSNAITFPQATGGSSVVTHFALTDATSDGELIAWGALDSTKTLESGDTPEFAAGDLNVTLD